MNAPASVPVSPFDVIRHIGEDGAEYWSARELLMGVPGLGYNRWENAEQAIVRASHACRNSGQDPAEQLREVTKLFPKGNGASQAGKDYHLSRYACYLVALNGDPAKPEIAAAQTYFAIRTRQAETSEATSPTREDLALLSDEELLKASERATEAIRRLVHIGREQQVIRREQAALQQEQLALRASQDQTEARVQALLVIQKKALEDRTALPLCLDPAAPKSVRTKIIEIVRSYCLRTFSDMKGQHFSDAFNCLYREFRDRCHIDLVTRSKNRGGKVRPLDIAQEENVLHELWALATELFGGVQAERFTAHILGELASAGKATS